MDSARWRRREAGPDDGPRLHADGGVVLTNSRDVAERFEKRHDNVLRDINGLELSSEVRAAWFRAASYIGADGTSRPSVDMTRDGFTILAMGSTGRIQGRNGVFSPIPCRSARVWFAW